ncbi:hypothetical protein ACFQ1M_10580 [Sungkyunkwania multivorans]|uniref:Uncharacterized protein n=1 Tax=Sungkyunkwania multivorans TaxID=1173618 RepID=A0ABW3CXX8_9FLAO
MKQPINLKLLGVKGDRFLLQYPNLSVPIEVSKELLLKLKHSKDYRIVDSHFTHLKQRDDQRHLAMSVMKTKEASTY